MNGFCFLEANDYLSDMILLGLLLALFIICYVFGKSRGWDLKTIGSTAMGIMLILTGVSHFVYTDGMILMLPHIVPAKQIVIYITGVFEIIAGVGLILPKYRRNTALLLMVFLIIILPANFKAAYDNLDLIRATYDGPGPEYLWFRVPLQVGFILWIWHFGFRKPDSAEAQP